MVDLEVIRAYAERHSIDLVLTPGDHFFHGRGKKIGTSWPRDSNPIPDGAPNVTHCNSADRATAAGTPGSSPRSVYRGANAWSMFLPKRPSSETRLSARRTVGRHRSHRNASCL